MKDFDTAKTIVERAIRNGWLKPEPAKPHPKPQSTGWTRERKNEYMRALRQRYRESGLTAQGRLPTRKWTDRNGLSKNHTLYMRWYREQKGDK